jgi:hypothetical protein
MAARWTTRECGRLAEGGRRAGAAGDRGGAGGGPGPRGPGRRRRRSRAAGTGAAQRPTRTRGGGHYGPPGRLQYTGHPVRVESSATSLDADAQRRPWETSEQMTGVRFAGLARSG